MNKEYFFLTGAVLASLFIGFCWGERVSEIRNEQSTYVGVSNQKHDSFDDKQATAEQLIILHYIRNHIATKENEMMFEHSDGIVTEQDYKDVIDRVHKKFCIEGLDVTYRRVD